MKRLYLPLYEALDCHPKVFRLAELLGVNYHEALGWLVSYWLLCFRQDPRTGTSNPPLTDPQLDLALRWNRDGSLADALSRAGFREDDGSPHDWAHHVGEMIASWETKRDAWRSRKRKYRDSNKKDEIQRENATSDVPEDVSWDVPQDNSETSRGRLRMSHECPPTPIFSSPIPSSPVRSQTAPAREAHGREASPHGFPGVPPAPDPFGAEGPSGDHSDLESGARAAKVRPIRKGAPRTSWSRQMTVMARDFWPEPEATEQARRGFAPVKELLGTMNGGDVNAAWRELEPRLREMLASDKAEDRLVYWSWTKLGMRLHADR